MSVFWARFMCARLCLGSGLAGPVPRVAPTGVWVDGLCACIASHRCAVVLRAHTVLIPSVPPAAGCYLPRRRPRFMLCSCWSGSWGSSWHGAAPAAAAAVLAAGATSRVQAGTSLCTSSREPLRWGLVGGESRTQGVGAGGCPACCCVRKQPTCISQTHIHTRTCDGGRGAGHAWALLAVGCHTCVGGMERVGVSNT